MINLFIELSKHDNIEDAMNSYENMLASIKNTSLRIAFEFQILKLNPMSPFANLSDFLPQEEYKQVKARGAKAFELIGAATNDIVSKSIMENMLEVNHIGFLQYHIAKKYFGKIGQASSIHSVIDVAHTDNIFIGDRSIIRFSKLWAGPLEGSINIGNDVYISGAELHCVFHGDENTGEFSRLPIAQQAGITKPIYIEDNVVIADGSKINIGVRIGEGAFIMQNSVITKDVEPYSIMGGAPAKRSGSEANFIHYQ